MTTRKFKLGPLTINAQAYGSQGNAILGIRDSGKTYTATEIAEHLFDAGVPFIAFDPTGVWRWLRVPGKGRGYPVVVAGGKGSDLPLTVTGAVEIVRAAMKNGVSLVLDLTDPNLSKADWKRIVKSCVRVLLQENAPYGLRHVFIEEAAEFVPQRVLDGDVYAEVEKLARIGGNARLGYTLINQRSQEVNKAVLELCENLFLHRQRGKNAIQSLDHWLGVAGVDQAALVKSLPGLPSGECWAWMGDREVPMLIKVPPKNSFHPDRRTMHGAKGKRGRKAVDVGSFVKDMKTALVALEAEAAAKDPVKLTAEIARLKAEKAKLEGQVTAAAMAKKPPDKADLKKIEANAIGQAKKHFAPLRTAVEAVMKFIVQINADNFLKGTGEAIDKATIEKAILAGSNEVTRLIERHLGQRGKQFDALRLEAQRLATHIKALIDKAGEDVTIKVDVRHNEPFTVGASAKATVAPIRQPEPILGDGTFNRPQMRVLRSLAMWRSLGHDAPSREMVAAGAGYSPGSGGFNNIIGGLSSAGALSIPQPGRLTLGADVDAPTIDEGRDALLSILTTPHKKLVAALNGAGAMGRDQLAEAAGYAAGSGGVNNLIGKLNTLGISYVPAQGQVALSDWAQELLNGYDGLPSAAQRHSSAKTAR